MAPSSSVWKDLEAAAIQALVASAKTLLDEASLSGARTERETARTSTVLKDDSDFQAVDNDTKIVVDNNFLRDYGYQYIPGHTLPVDVKDGAAVWEAEGFMVMKGDDTRQIDGYVTNNVTTNIVDKTFNDQLINNMVNLITGFHSQESSTFTPVKHSLSLPTTGDDGTRIAIQFDMELVFANINADGLKHTFVQYVAVYYHRRGIGS